jgi:hypothetical protein
MANLSTAGLSRFRRWYMQYKAINGTEPPTDLMNSYLAAEMEAEAAREQQSRQVSLQERSLDQQKEYQDKSFAQRQLEYNQNLDFQKDQLKANEQASMVSGVKDLASLGMEGYRTFKTPATTTTKPTYELGSPAISTAGAAAPSSSAAGSLYSGYGTTGLDTTAPAIDLSKYSGYGTNAGVTYDSGAGLSGAGSATPKAGINWGGLGTVAAGVGIGATRQPVTEYITDKGGVTAGKAASLSADVGTGWSTGASLGSALGGSAGYGLGGLIGAGIGLDMGAHSAMYNEKAIGSKQYGSNLGIGALFGLSSYNVAGISKEYNKLSSSKQKVADVLSGGVTKAISKMNKKLKKLF